MSALPLAEGPAMYLGGSIMTFALPYGAIIATAVALYLLFSARHSGPRLKYWSSAQIASTATREPAPAPEAIAPEIADPETAAPQIPGAEPAPPETPGDQA